MDLSDKDKVELEKRNENSTDYCPASCMSSDWQFSGSDITNSHSGLIHPDRQMRICRVDPFSNLSTASASGVDSFGPSLWDHSSGIKNLGVCDVNAQNTASTSNTVGIRGGLNSLRNVIDGTMDIVWNSTNPMLGGGSFLPNASGVMPHFFPHLPADPAFVERAAKFSCFSGGSFTDMMKPLGLYESIGPYLSGGSIIQGAQEILSVGGLKSTSSGQAQNNTVNIAEASKSAPLFPDHGANVPQNHTRSELLARSHDEANQCSVGSDNESDEGNSSGGNCFAPADEPSILGRNSQDISAKKHSAKKRKRDGQDNELEQAKETQTSGEATSNPEIPEKADQNRTAATNKITGEQGQKVSQALDAPKEYIHVRARRGKATNSHSLAERVRREKISERMKFLQDLVPGCSKVTGKAVMLDEIINYVQSLQRQVEFLSMKLATVSPGLDLNIEGFLAKDIFQSRALPSSTLSFSSDMPMGFPPLHPSQAGLIPHFPGMESHSTLLQRTVHSQLPPISGGFKEPAQLPNLWHDGLHDVQMSYGTAPPDNQDAADAGPTPQGQMKVEL